MHRNPFNAFYEELTQTKCTINVNDGKAENYVGSMKTLAGSLGSDINTIINATMRKASRKFSYVIIQ